MKITKETFELAISKGFIYSDVDISSEQSNLQEWLRNEKNLHINIYLGYKSFKWEIDTNIINFVKHKKYKVSVQSKLYDSYEGALEICLQEMLKLCV